MFANRSTLLGVELRGVKIIFVKCCTEGLNVVGFGSGKLAHGYIETMHKVHKRFGGKSIKKRTVCLGNRIPTHVRHFILLSLGHKPLYRNIEYAQTLCIPLFRVATQQLHAQADA